MKNLKETIKELSALYANEFINIRHHLHAHPELSFAEFETSKFIREKLTAWGIGFSVMAKTGVIGIIRGNNPDTKVIALRADMDALPIQELNKVDYRSVHDGVMHACGHDVHTTCLLGAAKILQELKHQWSGTVKLIFQPGEEKNPGGASILIKEGVLENPAPQAIFALHVNPALPVGKLSFRSGMVMASADEIYITVKGKGGHAAAPHLTADTILTAAQIVVNLQQVVSRMNNPFNPSVLSITSVQGGNATNVIPSEVKLTGTFRAMNEEWRFKAHELITSICKDTAAITGAQADVYIDAGYPFVINNEQLTEMAKRSAIEFAGAENVEETEMRMGAEDFAFYSHKIPACFFRLGVGNTEKNISSGVHTPTFNIDERAIENGVGFMAWLAVQ
ncbi:MAG TPA: M20 family metallopeptidase [Chitinophagaceae bacterium]|nr:M20 family metallopeptidase [Chitinophagaceae bacterium]